MLIKTFPPHSHHVIVSDLAEHLTLVANDLFAVPLRDRYFLIGVATGTLLTPVAFVVLPFAASGAARNKVNLRIKAQKVSARDESIRPS